MSYYPDQHGGQYPADEYTTPPTHPQPSQWDQQQQQESQHSQVSDTLQTHEQQPQHHQGLEQPHQRQQPLSLPPPPPQPLYPQHHIEDPHQLVPTQVLPRGTHDLTPFRLLPAPGRSPPVEIKPVMLQVDTTLRSTAHAGPSTRPASRARPHQYHPYPRPSSPSGHRREMEAHHHVRFPSQASTPQAPGSAMHSPALGTGGRQTFASPSEFGASPSFVSNSPLAAPPEGAFATRDTSAFAPFAPLGPPQAAPAGDERRYIIRTDTHYDPGTRVLTALLELPGLKPRDLRITLATTLFNRVRQLTVSGTSRPPFPPSSANVLRERKYGRFTRQFPVPADTKPEDVDAAMEDGVLVLKISCGLPAASADEHEIPIR
ncbi:hypothetical protein DFH07DRAFT_589903 [Mycena maculata]|uniref:SHSP domain-containing protein n=1 Tax=Mycena maculata TaxID=230809 RepID=A0AAD7INV0_9AGAR|nr:hypothetical protein DFH07DRAFT_589903 [Mycena maculata]